jgi:hypothetical protein
MPENANYKVLGIKSLEEGTARRLSRWPGQAGYDQVEGPRIG